MMTFAVGEGGDSTGEFTKSVARPRQSRHRAGFLASGCSSLPRHLTGLDFAIRFTRTLVRARPCAYQWRNSVNAGPELVSAILPKY